MTTQELTLMQGMVKKMDWLEERQKVLAQNIANADTPDYRPMDVTPPDFKDLLGVSTSSVSLSAPGLSTTDIKHLGLGGASGSSAEPDAKKQKNTYEVAPASNSVVLEEQLLKMNQNVTDHRLVSTLYQKNIDMLKASLKSQ